MWLEMKRIEAWVEKGAYVWVKMRRGEDYVWLEMRRGEDYVYLEMRKGEDYMWVAIKMLEDYLGRNKDDRRLGVGRN